MSRQGCRSTRGQLQCPQIPPSPHPTTHARAERRPWPRAGRPGRPHRGCSQQQRVNKSKQNSVELVCSYDCTVLCFGGSIRMGSCAQEEWENWWIFPGLKLDGALVPLNYLHLPFLLPSLTHTHIHIHIQTLPARVCWSMAEEAFCRWLLIGPQGPGGRVMGDTRNVVYV